MPVKFDSELSQLKDKIVLMGDTAEKMIQTAMSALVSRDIRLISKVNELEDEVDCMQVNIDDDAIRLMATFGPVALDLRFLLMTTRINTDLERIGDQSVNMCENVKLLVSEPELKKLVELPLMAEIATKMVHQALRAYRKSRSSLAREVIEMDNQVDELNDKIFRDLLSYMLNDAKNISRSIALILTARSLERIADHATNIAEEVIYMVKGEDVRHPEAMSDSRLGQIEP